MAQERKTIAAIMNQNKLKILDQVLVQFHYRFSTEPELKATLVKAVFGGMKPSANKSPMPLGHNTIVGEKSVELSTKESNELWETIEEEFPNVTKVLIDFRFGPEEHYWPKFGQLIEEAAQYLWPMIKSCDLAVYGVISNPGKTETFTPSKARTMEKRSAEEFVAKLSEIDPERMKNARVVVDNTMEWCLEWESAFVTWSPVQVLSSPNGGGLGKLPSGSSIGEVLATWETQATSPTEPVVQAVLSNLLLDDPDASEDVQE